MVRTMMANNSLRRQVAMTAGVWMFCMGLAVANLFAQAETPLRPQEPQWWLGQWVTPQNIVTIVVLVYGAGVLREQFAEVKRRVTQVEAEALRYRNETAPSIYARQDMTDSRLEAVEEQLAETRRAQQKQGRG